MTFGIGMNFGMAVTTVVGGQSLSVHLEINQVSSVQIPAMDMEGDPIDWTGMTLRFVVMDYRKSILLDLANESITRTSGSFTVAINAQLTAQKRTLSWRLLNIAGGQEVEVLEGLFPVY